MDNMLNRVKQFFTALTAKIYKEDIELVRRYLNEFEMNLFQQLMPYEQKHSINVAKDALRVCEKRKKDNLYNINEKRLIKACLLHDIGKINIKLNILDRTLLVIFDKLSGGKIKRIHNKKIDVYYNHGNIGYKLLRKYNYDDEFLYLIKNHHKKHKYENVNYSEELDILRECDKKN
jgi:putative nucleotidyltransferase with HDIG domain